MTKDGILNTTRRVFHGGGDIDINRDAIDVCRKYLDTSDAAFFVTDNMEFAFNQVRFCSNPYISIFDIRKDSLFPINDQPFYDMDANEYETFELYRKQILTKRVFPIPEYGDRASREEWQCWCERNMQIRARGIDGYRLPFITGYVGYAFAVYNMNCLEFMGGFHFDQYDKFANCESKFVLK